MENYFDDEIYAQDSESYMEYFSKNINNRGSKADKKTKETIAKYVKSCPDVSN